jgi:hypothetical protein
MGKFLRKGDFAIGSFQMHGRKKPYIGILNCSTNELVAYGQFHDQESADYFMEALADLAGAKGEWKDGD